ncbi:HAD family phosphatase [Schnuerera sp. xch1]|uniref:HAD family hydrolase n=1 Tax=Schnuerera sp. xch1 TaxID=2874283 RepID=UPI001CC05E89|nr:HAD family phosphatase [Schnuerera sp. xch1]MBZ2174433.1 HAD family phosphatase [Schnuerera sp. xch1]
MKAIIFDMDGVIVNSEPLHFELERELLKELGGNISKEEHDKFVGTTDYNMWTAFRKQFNLKPSVERMIEMKKERFIKSIHRIELIDNFKEFMLTIYNGGYPMAIASSNNKKAVNEIVKKFDLDRYMKFVISGEEVNKGKPNPEIFLTAANKMNVDPSECLVIEDADNGVKAAKAAGMKCIGLDLGNSGNQNLSRADLVVKNFNELSLDIVKGLFK